MTEFLCQYLNCSLIIFFVRTLSSELMTYINIKSKVSGSNRNYAFIDEIQEIDEFETALRQLFAEGIDLYCTGSNASILSGDLATQLSGRYIEFHINSLSYNEFLQFHFLQNNKDSLNKYIRFGGLPYLIHLSLEEDIVYGYLKSIYSTIILKDVVARYNIRDIDFLKVQRMDIIGKKRFEINEKYFFSDIGLKHSIIPYTGSQIGGVFENLVDNQLITEDYNVFIGKHQEREIDFVAMKGNEVKYVQVAYQLPDEKVREREFGNLLKIEDNYEKIVVSADEFAVDYKGVRHLHITEFLNSEA